MFTSYYLALYCFHCTCFSFRIYVRSDDLLFSQYILYLSFLLLIFFCARKHLRKQKFIHQIYLYPDSCYYGGLSRRITLYESEKPYADNSRKKSRKRTSENCTTAASVFRVLYFYVVCALFDKKSIFGLFHSFFASSNGLAVFLKTIN